MKQNQLIYVLSIAMMQSFHLCIESYLSNFGGDTEVGRGTHCIQMWIGGGRNSIYTRIKPPFSLLLLHLIQMWIMGGTSALSQAYSVYSAQYALHTLFSFFLCDAKAKTCSKKSLKIYVQTYFYSSLNNPEVMESGVIKNVIIFKF